jgi:hypothetical protein
MSIKLAEGFFRKYSPEEYEPLSAGTRPVSSINPLAIEVMRVMSKIPNTQWVPQESL